MGPLDHSPRSKNGLSSNMMALITSDCDAMRINEHQMALITSECRRYSKKLRFCYPALSGVLGGQTVLCAKGA